MGKPASDAAEELRTLIREANGVMKDLERERKAAQALLTTSLVEAVRTQLDEHVKRGLGEFQEYMKALMSRAETMISARFLVFFRRIMTDTRSTGNTPVGPINTASALAMSAAFGVDLTAPQYVGLFARVPSPEMVAVADEMDRLYADGVEPSFDTHNQLSAFLRAAETSGEGKP